LILRRRREGFYTEEVGVRGSGRDENVGG